MLCYTVLQVAEICNITTKTVFRNIQKVNSKYIVLVDRVQDKVQYRVQDKVQDNITLFNSVDLPCNTKYLITEKGLEFYKNKYVVADVPKQEKIAENENIIAFLQQQIAIKDEQINKLLQQNNNYQVIIAEMQSKNNLVIENHNNSMTDEQPKSRKKFFSFFKNK